MNLIVSGPEYLNIMGYTLIFFQTLKQCPTQGRNQSNCMLVVLFVVNYKKISNNTKLIKILYYYVFAIVIHYIYFLMKHNHYYDHE